MESDLLRQCVLFSGRIENSPISREPKIGMNFQTEDGVAQEQPHSRWMMNILHLDAILTSRNTSKNSKKSGAMHLPRLNKSARSLSTSSSVKSNICPGAKATTKSKKRPKA